jgi:SagB-type dehydrogenase family enzyme
VKVRPALYRRCPHVVAYWRGKSLILERYAPPAVQVSAAPITIRILAFLKHWRTAEYLFRRMPQHSKVSLQEVLDALVDCHLLERRDRSATVVKDAMASWDAWNPSAGLFHFSTKDVPFDTNLERTFHELQSRARNSPPPSPIKKYAGARKIKLPQPVTKGDFPNVLLARRTWRNFSSSPLSLADLSTLLGLTWKVQRWLNSPGIGRHALKTSPSGGALHPIEAYVLAPRVSDLPRGLYYYAPATHRLELLRKGATADQVEKYLGAQWWFRSAAAVVFMTAVFARTQWKYECPRAYRVVLTEAGHFCQTFCLVATWLNLAPFCTLALADSHIEEELRIDGVTESVVYAAGVGARPRNTEWNPLPNPR